MGDLDHIIKSSEAFSLKSFYVKETLLGQWLEPFNFKGGIWEERDSSPNKDNLLDCIKNDYLSNKNCYRDII